MARLTKEQLLAASAPVEFDSEPLGGSVLIQPLTAAAYISMQADFARAEKEPSYKADFMCRLVAASLVDDAGKRLFEAGELDSLVNLRGVAMLELFNKVMEVNGLTETPEGN